LKAIRIFINAANGERTAGFDGENLWIFNLIFAPYLSKNFLKKDEMIGDCTLVYSLLQKVLLSDL